MANLVGVYLNHGSPLTGSPKSFSLTARDQDSEKLAEMETRQAARGLHYVELVRDLSTTQATKFKAALQQAYEDAGYTYIPR